MSTLDTSFHVIDAQLGVFEGIVPTQLTVQNQRMVFPNGELYARLYPNLGFISEAKKDSQGVWQLQDHVSWLFGRISEEIGYGLSLSITPINDHPILRQNVQIITPTHPGYWDNLETLRKEGRFTLMQPGAVTKRFSFFYPDGTVGYRLQGHLSTIQQTDGRSYDYKVVMILPKEEFYNLFGDGHQFQFTGEHRTFFF